MSIFNNGVILFKNNNWYQAIKFWNLIGFGESEESQIRAFEDRKREPKTKINFPISLLFNLSIVNFINGKLDICLELC